MNDENSLPMIFPTANPQSSTSKNIVVCHSQVPFVRGGAEVLLDGLIAALRAEGHAVELVALPFKWYPHEQLEKQALAWRSLDLTQIGGRTVDLVICTKFPTWAVQHPHKRVWLVHQHRQVYDWYGTPLSDFGTDEVGSRARRVVMETDTNGLGEAERIFTISQNVADRLARYNGLKGVALYPPTHHDLYHNASYGDYIFTISRLDGAKRLPLLLEAMKKTKSGVRAIIAGSGPDETKLRALAAKLGLEKRVEFTGRISDERAVELYANALAVFYAPVDEDYGYVTIEGMKSGKAVLTAPDSGGVLEWVRDDENGFICADPAAFAANFDRLYNEREFTAGLGTNALTSVGRVPTWQKVARTLVE